MRKELSELAGSARFKTTWAGVPQPKALSLHNHAYFLKTRCKRAVDAFLSSNMDAR
jgi:hypothetical protein